MVFLAYGLLLAFVLGAGTLTASIIPTRGARIGLGSVVFLAAVMDSTWVAAPLYGWSPALADALWIGVFVLVMFSAAMVASYYRGTVGRPNWTWPSLRDALFMVMVIGLFGTVLLVLPVPLDTDAQGFGYLALTLREGHNYTTLAPWHPETEYLYSPGYIGLLAHLSARFDLGLHTLQLILGAVIAVLFVWTAYDLGTELGGPRMGRGFMVAALIGTGLATAFMDSHFSALLALLFSLAFITFVMRLLHMWRLANVFLAAVCLAAVPLSQPDMTIALIIGYVPWLIVVWLSKPRPRLTAWLAVAVLIPLLALLITLPWLESIRDLLGSDIESPFVVDRDHGRTLIMMHGGIIVVLAVVGIITFLRRRHPVYTLALVWLVGIVEFSTLGLLEKNLPDLMEPLLKYDYPFSLAWHGPIIPYTILGGLALVWLTDRLGGKRLDRWIGRLVIAAVLVVGSGLAAGVLLFNDVLEVSKDYVDFYGAFSSEADVEAMTWIRDNTPPDARILNHPGPHEGDWAPVITERDTVYFRPQPFFRGTEKSEAEQAALRAFWTNPLDSRNADRLAAAGIRYVLVPQVFGDPDRFEDMVRWREPIPEAATYRAASVQAARYLRLVDDWDGAQLYEVVP